MADPRYPIGRFSSLKRPLTDGERRERIDRLRELPARLSRAVEGLSEAQLETPYRDGGWTVRQLVHHVMDSHVNAYVRFKLAATEEHPTVRPYDEKRWAELPEARSLSIAPSLATLEGLHARWAAHLEALEPRDFARTLRHPDIGDITVDFLLELYAWHGAHHTAHVTALRERCGW
jgi:uncharacterized damage-inducible protein DinB